MIARERIINSLRRSAEFLINCQERDGSWQLKQEGGSKYRLYEHPIVLTSQALQSLSYQIRPEYISKFMRALHYCYVSHIEDAEEIDLHAWKLSALNFSSIGLASGV